MCDIEEKEKDVIEQENNEIEQKTPKKRGRKPNPEKRSGYFYEEEEQAFRDYVQSTDPDYRNKLFREKLYPAFTKMIESISRRYGLFTPSESFEDTFYDTMSYLMTKVNKFDTTKGYKAYSYCGTVCKRYLLLKRTQDMKRRETTLPYDAVFNATHQDKRTYEIYNTNTLANETIQRTVKEIEHMVSPDYKEKLTENERNVGIALLELLKNWEEIFTRLETKKFNKTSAYYFIKEYTMLSSKEVRDAMKKYKNLYFFTKQKIIDE